MNFPTLYKKSSTGKIQIWKIETYESADFGHVIQTTHGQLEGKLQITQDLITEGKNIGRSNETSPEQQADLEAKSKWEKQLKSGYVESVEAAQNGDTNEIIEGGILPMLAHTFEKQGKKIKYPCHVQPKLDGIRCIAILKDGKCTLWSRTRKPINSCPHIIREIESNFSGDLTIDGELYNHDFKTNFEHIVHLVRQDNPDVQCTDVEYHIYDIVNKDPFYKRNEAILSIFNTPNLKYLKMVDTLEVENEDQVADFYTEFKDLGYEGCMLRNSSSFYTNKRSSDLIKVKEMQDAEFVIVGCCEGRGKLQGHIGAFICLTEDGQEFNVKMSGITEKLKEYFEDDSLWSGKQLTVQFQDYSQYGVPRFPVGLRIREME